MFFIHHCSLDESTSEDFLLPCMMFQFRSGTNVMFATKKIYEMHDDILEVNKYHV